MDTGDAELVGDNAWGDRIWGICLDSGENDLGKILMRIRDELRVKKQLREDHSAWSTRRDFFNLVLPLVTKICRKYKLVFVWLQGYLLLDFLLLLSVKYI